MGFSFRLDKILELRQLREKEELRRLAELEAGLRRAEQLRVRLSREQAACEQELRQLQQSGDAPHIWGIYHHHLAVLRRRLQEAAAAVRRSEELVARQRQRVVEARRDRKVLETLRERKWEEFHLEQQRRDQAVLDEIAGTMYRVQKGDAAWGS